MALWDLTLRLIVPEVTVRAFMMEALNRGTRRNIHEEVSVLFKQVVPALAELNPPSTNVEMKMASRLTSIIL
jgi:hypothetical protein